MYVRMHVINNVFNDNLIKFFLGGKMKFILTFFVVFFIFAGLCAQTYVPDANFREAINDELGQPVGYDPTIADLNSLTGLLDVGDEGILSIEGAQYLTGIDRLYIDDNQISNLSPVAGLTNLERLFADGNQIVDISPVANLTALVQLKLDGNLIVDISAVSGLTDLYYLDLGENQIEDISPLSTLTTTSWIYLDNNQISSISALEGLVELDRLYLHNNKITEIYHLVQNAGLESGDLIYLERNGVSNPLSVEALAVHVPALEARGVDVHYPASPNLEAACYPDPEREDNTVSPANVYFTWQGSDNPADVTYKIWAGISIASMNYYGDGVHGSGTEWTSNGVVYLSSNMDMYWQIETVTTTGSLWSEIWHFSTPDANAVFADFSADQTTVTNATPITFTDESYGSITTWSWDFDNDGTIDSTDENPIYTYTTSGTYTVSLTVGNGIDTDTETKVDYITVDFVTPEFTDLGLLQSNDQSTWTPVNGSMYDYSMLLDPTEQYYFLDMTAASATNTPLQVGLHPFYFDGVPAGFFDYWAAKNVFDGCVPVDPNLPWEPIMYQIISSNLPVFYISYAADGSWQLVDGLLYELDGTQDDFRVNGDYLIGDYTITGNVTGANGIQSEDISVDIEFYTFEPDFEADQTSVIPGTTVQFTDLSNETPTAWSWDLDGDGIEDSDLQNPTFTYNTVGTYDVTLTVEWGAYDDTETKTEYIVVADLVVPDENFREALNDILGEPSGYYPTIADLNGITGTVDVSDEEIISIEGAQYLTGIDRLYIDDNQIVDLSPIAGLTNLERLFADGNEIIDISAVANLTALDQLKLDGNEIVDISAVSGLTNLYYIDLGENLIVDISPLSTFTTTSWIYLDNNFINEISALSGLLELDRLYIYGNEITDIYPLTLNTGFGDDDVLYLERYGYGNPISHESMNVYIPILETLGFSTLQYPSAANLEAACYPVPNRDATGVSLSADLQWQGNFPTDNATYKVWFGEAADNLSYVGDAISLGGNMYSFTPTLALNGEYWWRIECVGATETVWSGLWHFELQTIQLPEFTDMALNKAFDPVNGPWTAVSSTSMYDYSMTLDPNDPFVVADYYFLDIDNTVAATNMTIDSGQHPFYLDVTSVPDDFYTYWAANNVTETYATNNPGTWQALMWPIINGTEPMFLIDYNNIVPNGYFLLDGLQWAQGNVSNFIINSDYPAGDYVVSGNIESGTLVSNDIEFDLSLSRDIPEFTDLALIQAFDPVNGPWTAVPSTSNYDYSMILDPNDPFVIEDYYFLNIDNAVATTNIELQAGQHPFYLDVTSVPDDFYTYWAAKGVDGTVYTAPEDLWKNFMWPIINGTEPMFLIDFNNIVTNGYFLLDGLQWAIGDVSNFIINSDYPLGDYVVTGTVLGANLEPSEDISFNMNFHGISADFEADATSVTNGTEIQFTDLSTGNPTTWEWDFDNDGIIDSTDENPAYTYPGGGTYTVSLTVSNGTDTDTETKTDYITVAGTHFVKCWSGNGYQNMTFHIYDAAMNGEDLDVGDEIGIFDGNLCVGSLIYNGDLPFQMIASQDDPDTPESDGFSEGHDITFKLWNESSSTEYLVPEEPSYLTGDVTFTQYGTAFTKLFGYDVNALAQDIPLYNSWNLVSTYVQPYDLDMAAIFDHLIYTDALVKVQDESGNALFEIPGDDWYNGIGDLTYTEGYYTKVNADNDLYIFGDDFVTLPIDIQLSAGWNIISYPCNTSQAALPVIQPLIDLGVLEKVQNEMGLAIWFDGTNWLNQINTFYPGDGYFIKVNADCTLTIDVPTDVVARYKNAQHSNEPLNRETYHFQPEWQNNPFLPMNFYINDLEVAGVTLEANDELAVFDGDLCAGTAQVGENDMISLIAATDDVTTTEIDGFTNGNDFTFRFWDSSTDTEYSDFQYTNLSGNATFLSQGTTQSSIEFLPTSGGANLVPVTTEMFQNYPNPFNPETTISFGINDAAHVTLEVYNIKGEKVTTLIDGNLEADYYNVVWDGTDSNNKRVSTGVYFYKMKADKFVQTKKMILMK
ncbi:MAG: PKD domain-containing protein [Candidatus Cloacimonetes bacterium]|nr:PKD domain-containing protein [Candidatus Cloacimonadota bacterium]MCF7813213.1 PKD domain-containing protein [Candidatus Cloacimonadota bacterium]MCF7867412.1 PKD domain-containing protein [Candidatus Cloacimonadota bacterium]MCF7882956.1 PKD domain-containing protein [Candidatus Cloacimonadota bacterium]